MLDDSAIVVQPLTSLSYPSIKLNETLGSESEIKAINRDGNSDSSLNVVKVAPYQDKVLQEVPKKKILTR